MIGNPDWFGVWIPSACKAVEEPMGLAPEIRAELVAARAIHLEAGEGR